MEWLKSEVVDTRRIMMAANFTKGIREAMDAFFRDINARMIDSEGQIDEIRKMMDTMYQKYAQEHGTSQASVPVFSIVRYQKELMKLEQVYKEQFATTANMLVNEKMMLTSKFFETLANRVINVYEVANQDVENWLKVVIAPMESQVREQKLQLQRRMESIKRIDAATSTLEERIAELESLEKGILDQIADLNVIRRHISNALVFQEKMAADGQMA
jgi:hypothetical protein